MGRPAGWVVLALVGSFLAPGCTGNGSGGGESGPDEEAAVASGSRSFERWVALEDSGATSANVSLGDLDGDGHLDLLLVKGRHWPLDNLILLGNGSGGFAPPRPLGGPADRSYSGVLVDLDRDGDLDVVVSNDEPDPKTIHLNDGTGRFSVGEPFGRGEWSTRHLRVADLNQDGLPDAVLANRYGPAEGPSHVCFGEPGGRLQRECHEVTRGSATTIVPADVDGDGIPDLIVPHRDGGQSFVYLNDGEGGFRDRRPFGPPDAAIRSALPLHLDEDGLLDLVAIDPASGPVVFRGSGEGAWSEGEPLGSIDERPYALAVHDVDADGRTDILVGFVEARPVIWFNDGPEGLTPVRFGDELGVTYGFAVGDVDEDGLLDIAMARSDAPNVLYFGTGIPPR